MIKYVIIRLRSDIQVNAWTTHGIFDTEEEAKRLGRIILGDAVDFDVAAITVHEVIK